MRFTSGLFYAHKNFKDVFFRVDKVHHAGYNYTKASITWYNAGSSQVWTIIGERNVKLPTAGLGDYTRASDINFIAEQIRARRNNK